MKNAFDVEAFMAFFDAIYGPHIFDEDGQPDFTPAHLTCLSANKGWAGPKISIHNPAAMAEWFSTGRNNEQAFWKLGPMRPNITRYPKARGGTQFTVGTPAFFADIDLADGIHAPLKGRNEGRKLATMDEALAALRTFPYAPTVIVHSGGGLHVYWRLSYTLGPNVLANPAIPGEYTWTKDSSYGGENVAHRFDLALDKALNDYGLAHGGVGLALDPDVVTSWAQAPRVPGSLNVKSTREPRPVRILEIHPEREVDPEQLMRELPELPAPAPVNSAHIAGTLRSLGGSTKVKAARGKAARRFEEAVEVSYLMENLWGMRKQFDGRWALPRPDGSYNTDGGHAGVIRTANGKVELAVVYGARLQELWGLTGYDESVSSWDLVLKVCGDEFLAEAIIKLCPKPSEKLIEKLRGLLDKDSLEAALATQ